MTLLEFVAYLSDRGLIEADKLKEDSDSGFDNRLKTQKYIYLATYYGLDLKYEFNRYLYGPYSMELTKDNLKLELDNSVSATVPDALDEPKFLSTVKGKTTKWLEIVTTILYLTNKEGAPTHERMYNAKPRHTKKLIDSAYEDVYRLIYTHSTLN